MLQQKICMLGSFGVGKTSLVSRYVHSRFSEVYHTTIGVKVDRKVVTVDDREVKLVLWDLHGDDEFQRVHHSYLRGMAGYLLVIDGTRGESVEVAERLHALSRQHAGDVPFLCLINKSDLHDEWEISAEEIAQLQARGWELRETSAKTGASVQESFEWLAKACVRQM